MTVPSGQRCRGGTARCIYMKKLTDTDALCVLIEQRLSSSERLICVFEGRCASGKTTAADAIAERLGGEVVHTDDFFLPPGLRTPERLTQPGGNVHYERLKSEVIEPLTHGEKVTYRAFDCSIMDFGKEKTAGSRPLIIIEGAYSLHPILGDYFDIAVFFDIELKEQRRRILARGGKEKLAAFESRWIPLEESYLAACSPERRCEVYIDTSERGAEQ